MKDMWGGFMISYYTISISGKYFSNQQERRSSSESYDLEAARRLWQVSVEMTGVGGKENF